MSERGVLLPFAQREEFDTWLESADAFLITQSFDEKNERLMETNFPSKLVEYAQYGKPLIIWGPDYSSGHIWAIQSGQGMVIDKQGPDYLKQVLEQLCGDFTERQRLADAARDAADGCFNPRRIQSDFMEWLGEIAE